MTELVLSVISILLGGVNLGFVLKMMYNHLAHLREDIKELRQTVLGHIQDHDAHRRG